MGIFRKVPVSLWTNVYFLELDSETKVLYLYLLSGQHSTSEGLYHVPLLYMAADLQRTPDQLRQQIEILIENGFIKYDFKHSVVLVIDVIRHVQPDNQNQRKAAVRKILELPGCHLINEFYRLAERYCEPLAEDLYEPLWEQSTSANSLTLLASKDRTYVRTARSLNSVLDFAGERRNNEMLTNGNQKEKTVTSRGDNISGNYCRI